MIKLFSQSATKGLGACLYFHLLFLGCLICQQAEAAQERWQDPDYILSSFIEIALKNEFDADTGQIRKWTSPVNVWLDHRVGEQNLHTRLVTLQLNELSRITGHPISLVSSKNQANVVVIFTRFEDMAELSQQLINSKAAGSLREGTLCVFKIQADKNQAIHHATIIIPVDQAQMSGQLVSCIVEELTQVLGLVNDSEKVYPSIFNDKTPNALLTGLDYLLLRILYDSRLKPGMHTEEVKVIVRNIIKEMIKSGEVDNAWQMVKESELYPLLGY